ncbi:MAG TPA: FHA domain-containing protein [Myxococcota bacterium]|nr:FHA domain-containing protein [Myxococcota bacterium]
MKDQTSEPESYDVSFFAADCALNPVARVQRHGDAFLVLMPGVLSRPIRAQSTDLVGSNETLEGKLAPAGYRVCPLRKRGLSLSPHVTVGRTANNDIVLSDVSVSKVHAYLRREGADYAVLDAGSRNGTFVDEKPAPAKGRPLRLETGARVRFGTVEAMFLRAVEFWRFVEGLAAGRALPR